MVERLPVFVYGTLRPGQYNYLRLLDGLVRSQTRATLPGHALYGREMAFPYVVPDPGRAVVGDLVTPAAAAYDEVLARLDRLEGYSPTREADSHYVRTRCTVLPHGAHRPVVAWVYLAGPRAARRLDPDALAESGDWLEVCRAA